jgi:phosphoglycolate phosphatase-like HAD superfamily hydrolase
MTTSHTLEVTGPRGAPNSIKAIVWDFDDTIADTIDARIHAMRRTFEQAKITHTTAEVFVVEQRGVPLQVSLDGLETQLGLALGLTNIYRAAYWVKRPGLLRLFEGMGELLSTLQHAQVPMGIVTSKARDIVVEGVPAGTVVELAELGLDWLAPHTVGFEDVTHPKPHPEGLQRVLDRLGVAPYETLVIGDSHADIQLAHNGGAWSCLAGWGVPLTERDLTLATPDLIAEHPLALLSLLED